MYTIPKCRVVSQSKHYVIRRPGSNLGLASSMFSSISVYATGSFVKATTACKQFLEIQPGLDTQAEL
jgi:hypothetical protein